MERPIQTALDPVRQVLFPCGDTKFLHNPEPSSRPRVEHLPKAPSESAATPLEGKIDFGEVNEDGNGLEAKGSEGNAFDSSLLFSVAV